MPRRATARIYELTSALHATFPSPFDELWLTATRDEFFRALRNTMVSADQAVEGQPNWGRIAGFFRRLDAEFSLSIVTTNYDSVVERALGWGAAEQGFDTIAGERTLRFAAHARRPRLMHLHGSLSFGYRESSADPNRFIFEDDHEDLYLHGDTDGAFRTWFGRSTQRSMAGRDTVAGPIITGLEKPDKLLPEPYMSYYRHLQDIAVGTPRVLIVGYGFGDVHVNPILSRLTKWHGSRRRVAIIDYCAPAMWTPSSVWAGARPGFYQAAARLAEDPGALDVLNWPDPWAPAARPGQLEVYFRGFAGTIAAHENRMIQFLRS